MTKLTLAEAEEILSGTLRRGEALGKAFSVAIVDAGGHLIAAKRSDGGSRWATPRTRSSASSERR